MFRQALISRIRLYTYFNEKQIPLLEYCPRSNSFLFLIVSSKFKYPQEDSYLDFESAISHETLLSQLLKPN
jgi:hypothetical protein